MHCDIYEPSPLPLPGDVQSPPGQSRPVCRFEGRSEALAQDTGPLRLRGFARPKNVTADQSRVIWGEGQGGNIKGLLKFG